MGRWMVPQVYNLSFPWLPHLLRTTSFYLFNLKSLISFFFCFLPEETQTKCASNKMTTELFIMQKSALFLKRLRYSQSQDLCLDNNTFLKERRTQEWGWDTVLLITGGLVVSTQTSECVSVRACVISACMHACTNWPCHVFMEYVPRGLWGSRLLQGKGFHLFGSPFELQWLQRFCEEREKWRDPGETAADRNTSA